MLDTNLKKNTQFIWEKLSQLYGKKVMIVGDLGVDEYVIGDVRRISPEAPVPVLEARREDLRVGLSANVAQNVASLGGEAILIGVVGNDSTGEDLKRLLEEANVNGQYLVTDHDRPTTRKLRVMADHHHIVRVDYEKKSFLSDKAAQDLIATVKDNIKKTDVVVLQDYAKGVLSKEVCQQIIEIAHDADVKVLLDPHRSTPIDYYKGVDLFKPNRDEAFILSGLKLNELRINKDSINEVGQTLLKEVECQQLVLTQGKDGMSLFEDGNITELPTFAKQVFDVTGAGDTVIAALALGWSSGFTLEQSCVLANLAAGVVVAKVGCVPCSLEDLHQAIGVILD